MTLNQAASLHLTKGRNIFAHFAETFQKMLEILTIIFANAFNRVHKYIKEDKTVQAQLSWTPDAASGEHSLQET